MAKPGSIYKVLDKGYVKLINFMGTEESIIEAARMSTDGGFVSWEPYEKHPNGDLGLLEHLYSNRHSTPFEMCELLIEVQAPIFVFREWQRHRTQSYNEFSARYAEMPDLHYIPEVTRIQKQSKNNKQGSGEPLSPTRAQEFINDIGADQDLIYLGYKEMLEEGVAKEVARINTPVSRYSKMRAKANLRNWLAFCLLRCDTSAQWEIREYADCVANIISQLWPRVWKLFEEYDFLAERFSNTEMNIIRNFFTWTNPEKDKIEAMARASGLSPKKVEAFMKKLTE